MPEKNGQIFANFEINEINYDFLYKGLIANICIRVEFLQ